MHRVESLRNAIWLELNYGTFKDALNDDNNKEEHIDLWFAFA